MKLFKMTNGVLELDREEITLYKEFRVLLLRDKGSKGDSDGRKKLMAFKEFKYIYFLADFNSFPNQHGLNERDSHMWAVDNCDLPEDYIPDDEVLTAMNKYVEMTTSVPKELIIELLATFRNNIKVVRKLRERINKIVDRLEKLGIDIADIEEEEKLLTKLLKSQKELVEIAEAIPNILTSLRKSEELLNKDETTTNIQLGRGGEEIGDSMDPSKSLR